MTILRFRWLHFLFLGALFCGGTPARADLDYPLPELPAQPALPAPKTPNSVSMGNPASFAEVKMDFPIRSGPFQPTWSSIAAHYPAAGAPSWLRAAKFGIFVHFGPQSSLNSGDWSAQHMYQPGAAAYNANLAANGHPTVSGYKDVVKAWNPVNYDPAALAQLFYDSGVRFVLVQGVHHDNFDNWDSKYNPWNMKNFGAKRDTMAEWATATKALGLRMGVAFHHEYSWWFYQPAFKSDSTGTYAGIPYDAEALRGASGAGTWWENYDPSRLYNTNLREYSGVNTPNSGYWNPTSGIFLNHLDYAHWYATQWALRVIDVIEKYDPDFIYTDGNSTGPFTGYATGTGYKCDAVQRVMAHYYNRALAKHGQVDTLSFIKFHYPGNGVATTSESSYPADIKVDQPWSADLSIGPWFWQSGTTVDTGKTLVNMIVETSSRDGAAFVNIPIDGTGSLGPGVAAMLGQVGQWMARNGAGIYGSRAWSSFREGSFRFTVGADGYLYAFYLGVPAAGAQLTISALGSQRSTLAGPITSVSLLGSNSGLTWSQSATGLTITCPSPMPAVPTGAAICFKIGSPAAIGGPSPIRLAASPGAGNIRLSWEYSIFAPAATFTIKRATSVAGPFTPIASGVSGLTYTDSTAASGTVYYYTVTAVSSAGESAPAPYATTTMAGSLTSDWTSQDVGNAGVAGSFAPSGGTLTLNGSGADIWGSADAFRYAFKIARGDCTVTARVVSQTNTGAWAKAGVMVRSSLGANASYAIAFMSPSNGFAFQQRATTGGSAAGVTNTTGIAAPYWVRITRVGSTFTAYRSANGTTWTASGSVSITMPSSAFVGLVVCSTNNSVLGQAQFDNVTITGTANLPFDESGGATAADVNGNGWDATLAGGATFAAGKINNALALDGSSQYATLPAGVVNGMGDFTIAAWVKPNGANTGARVFDFGTGTTAYMCLLPRNSATSVARFAITTGGSAAEQQINGNAAISPGVWTHVAVTISGTTGTLYLNGAVSGTKTGLALTPGSLGATTNNYLGRSQFSADPFFSGQIDDLRIVNRALTAAQIAALVTPPAAPSGLAATPADRQVALGWNAVSGASAYNVKRSAVPGGPYTTIGWKVTGTAFTDSGLTNGVASYYVVSAVSGESESAASAEVGASPLSPPAAAPGGLSAVGADSQVTLSWNPSPGATAYVVRRAPVSNGAYATVGTVTSPGFTDSGVVNGTAYYYVVSATNAAGASADYSAEVGATPLTAYQRWKVDHGLAFDAPDTSIPDRDGISVLLKYAVGLTPGTPAANPAVLSGSAPSLSLAFQRRSPAPVTYVVEASSDLSAWTPIATLDPGSDVWSGTAVVNEEGSGELLNVTVRDSAATSAGARRFLRLRVTGSP